MIPATTGDILAGRQPREKWVIPCLTGAGTCVSWLIIGYPHWWGWVAGPVFGYCWAVVVRDYGRIEFAWGELVGAKQERMTPGLGALADYLHRVHEQERRKREHDE